MEGIVYPVTGIHTRFALEINEIATALWAKSFQLRIWTIWQGNKGDKMDLDSTLKMRRQQTLKQTLANISLRVFRTHVLF